MPDIYLSLAHQPGKRVVSLAQEAELLGFDGIALPDHIAMPMQIAARYPDSDRGAVPFDPAEADWLDPLIGLTATAAVTERLRLMTRTLLLPLRNRFVVAKAVSTIETMFPGRLVLGIGAGWMKEEFDILQVPFSRRYALLEDGIRAIRALSIDGGVTMPDFASIVMRPTCLAVPIYLAGSGQKSVIRAATIGDGYVAMQCSASAVLTTVLPMVRQALAQVERDVNSFHIGVALAGDIVWQDLVAMEEAGVNSVQVSPLAGVHATSDAGDAMACLRRFAGTVLAHYMRERHNA